jgi:hypothetical protein
VLEISEEQYTGGVRQHIETLKRRASTAEEKLASRRGTPQRGMPIGQLAGQFPLPSGSEPTTRARHSSPPGPLRDRSGRVGQFGQSLAGEEATYSGCGCTNRRTQRADGVDWRGRDQGRGRGRPSRGHPAPSGRKCVLT